MIRSAAVFSRRRGRLSGSRRGRVWSYEPAVSPVLAAITCLHHKGSWCVVCAYDLCRFPVISFGKLDEGVVTSLQGWRGMSGEVVIPLLSGLLLLASFDDCRRLDRPWGELFFCCW